MTLNWRQTLTRAGLFFGLAWPSFLAFAAFEVPRLTGPVMDQVGWITPVTQAQLEASIEQVYRSHRGQLQIFITDSLGGLPIEQVALQVAERWKLGDAKRDDGILFLIAPHERRLRIEVGQGLEGLLPDVLAKRIIEDVVKPQIRAGQTDQAVLLGTAAIFAQIAPDAVSPEQTQVLKRAFRTRKIVIPGFLLPWISILFLVFVVFLYFVQAKLGSRGFISRRGGWGSLGGGGFGSGGGSHWSGGGGGFSGGGSSGSW